MTNVFSDKEKAAAVREKRLLFWTWFAVMVVVVAAVAALTVTATYRVSVHRDRSLTLPFGIISAALGIGFSCGSLFFFAIKYKLTRKYVKMLREMDRGLKDKFDATFIGYEDSVTMKDGVYFYSMSLKTKPLRRDDIDERKLLVEHTVPKLPLCEGTKLRLVSHANILMAYEILETPASAPVAAQNDLSSDTKQ